jgi:3-hydroxyacyl-[acyl-carrier-protein] dehydratase
MRFEVLRLIHADHPSLPGHFPGAPLVPGVVILDEVVAAVDEWRRDSQLSGVHSVKFLAPLNPEQPFTISLSATSKDAGEVSFCCSVDERVIVEGRLAVIWGAK